MKNILATIAFSFVLIASVSAQKEIVEVKVELNNGKTVEGLMHYDPSFPWKIQKSVSLFDESLRNAKKVKKKDKTEYKAKDVKGMEFDGRIFETHKVAPTGNGDMGSTFGAIPRPTMIEVIDKGAINMWRAYGYPPKVASGVDFQTIYDDLRSNPEYLLERNGDGKFKTMNNINIEKWIADAPNTSERFANGEFGNFKRKEGKKLGNFMKGMVENQSSNIIYKVVEAYNDEMAGN